LLGNPLIIKRLSTFLLLFFVFSAHSLKAQCNNGSQPECKCSTAPVLCTIDELDGYTFSMASFQHPNDGPSPICPGANMTQTNNPTWFAFTAWCTNLSLRVSSTNCQQSGGAIGFQLAIYTNCSFNNLVACNADVDDCNTNAKILNLTGLNIGSIYYFMVDGCLGSYCTVTIDIIGVCGQEQVEPWTLPVEGNMNPCAGHTETYTVQDLDGARIYHWFLDGALAGQTTTESFDITWTTPGTYQLCIDASNDPCVDISNPPAPLCTTITVHKTEAGTLNVTPSIHCPGDLAYISNTGYTTGIGNGQFIIITDATGLILNVRPGGTFQFLHDTAGIFNVYAYNYLIPGGTIPVTGGNINDIDCTADCCDIVSQTITYQSIEANVSDIICDDHGTGNDPTDDTFTFDVLVTGLAPGTWWRSTDGTVEGSYGIPVHCGPYLISGGVLNFDFVDYYVTTCWTSITLFPPAACSSCVQTMDAGSGSLLNCINTQATLKGICSDAGAYHWSGPNSFSSDSLTCVVSDSGWYYLTVDFGNQCLSTDSVFVDLDGDAPVADAGADQLIDCGHKQVLLDATGSIGDNLQFVWSTLTGNIISTQTVVLVDSGGTYILQLTNSVNGCSSTDTAKVNVNQNELGISVNVLDEICDGENNGSIGVTGISAGVPPYTYKLDGNTQDTIGQYINLSPGGYHLQITDANGCSVDTFIMIRPGIHLDLNLPEILQFNEDQNGMINTLINVPLADLQSIQWSPPGTVACDTCLSTIVITKDNQVLHLVVVHINGCTATKDLDILVIPTPNIYVPNTFSPNGDGFNDFFTIFSNDGVESILELNIFDRWGDHLYQARNINSNVPGFGWDGTFHQKDMPSGTFVYYIKLLLTDGTEKKMTGDVTLVR